MKYTLNNKTTTASTFSAIRKLLPLLKGDEKNLVFALFGLLMNTAISLITPIIIGNTIDGPIQHRQYEGIVSAAVVLLSLYIIGFIANYYQMKIMGSVGQRLLFNLRGRVFMKLQELPIAFFNQNKAGDLISRINNDTDRLNEFFSRSLMQFIGNMFLMVGTAICILFLDIRLGIAALIPAIVLLVVTRMLSPWIRRKNATNLKAVGSMSAEISESLDNFKVIVAFNRRDFFRQRFEEVNEANYQSSINAGFANTLFTPIYGLAATIAQVIVLFYGIYLITTGSFTIGFLVSYFVYLTRFYDPIRQIAGLWSSFQVAIAGWDRISEVLALKSNLSILPSPDISDTSIMSFKNVSFGYEGKDVLKHITFDLEAGKTYALVGPTGGGKTTTALLMARLYDPTHGEILLDGKDIRSYQTGELTKKVGFILQEPFLFTGTVRDNILYGNDDYRELSSAELTKIIEKEGLGDILIRFDKGLETDINSSGESISLGQKQLIAFIRAILRKPDLLILDEATANIDTMTEQLLGNIIDKLPSRTTKIIIAHRLNTIENADEIFFVNAGEIIRAGSFENAIKLLLKGKRAT